MFAALLARAPPVLVGLLGIALLTFMDGFIKSFTGRHAVLEVAFLRFLAGTAIAAALYFAWRTPAPSRASVRGNLLRGVFSVLTASSFFYGLSALPIAEVFALTYVSPILVAILSMPMLGERPGKREFAAIGLGFAGVLVAIGRIDFATVETARLLGVGATLFSAFTYALVVILLRRQAQRDPPITIVLFQTAVPMVVFAGPAAMAWTPPSLWEWAALPLIGSLGVAGHLALTYAFARVEASKLVTIEYSGFVWAAGMGLFIFGEVPSASTLFGAALIVSGCFLIRR